MKFAYADPPYLGLCNLYDHKHHGGGCWDHVATHASLIVRLCDEFSDGWVLSLHTPSLRKILNLCPDDVRVGAWVKPFASFKPGVNPAYAWEPVIFRGGRKRERDDLTVRDWVSCNITLQRGFTGAKPDQFCFWLFELMGAEVTDDFTDIFHGSGAVSRAWESWRAQTRIA
jgi:hypothetical protein